MPKHIPEPTPEPIEYSEGYDGPRFLPLEKHAGPPDYRAATHTWGG